MKVWKACAILGLSLFLSCSDNKEKVGLKKIIGGLEHPTFLTSPASDKKRLFIVEKSGRIRILRDGKLLPRPFLDISQYVWWDLGEMGFLGLAFHPNYSSNGYFYVHYTDFRRRIMIVRYERSADPDVADPASAKTILKFRQPTKHHHGGMLLFGPDNMLYIGIGDGGLIGDPHEFAQNKSSIQGNILRIDVDHGDPYAVPADNPFVGEAGVVREIWFKGLRNPYRFSIDRKTNLLYIGDTGEKLLEEIDVIPFRQGGTNFGWNIMEGTNCFTKDRKRLAETRYTPASTCDRKGLILPAVEYSHREGCAVIGGVVYRGTELSSIQGHYFYADYCFGWIRSFQLKNGVAQNRKQWEFGVAGNVLSFGEDSERNLFVLYEEGNVYRFVNTE